MFYITKGSEPGELTTFRQNIINQKKTYDWNDCPIQVKNAIRKKLVLEQNGLCAYCTREIGEDCQIEHFYSRNQYSQKMFDYDNMLGVDNSKKVDYRFKGICENGRGSKSLTLSPLDQTLMNGIYYLSDGTIKHDLFQNDLDNVLHLNHNVFKMARKNLLKAVKARMPYCNINTLISTYETEPYGGIVVYYLNRLKKNPNFQM